MTKLVFQPYSLDLYHCTVHDCVIIIVQSTLTTYKTCPQFLVHFPDVLSLKNFCTDFWSSLHSSLCDDWPLWINEEPYLCNQPNDSWANCCNTVDILYDRTHENPYHANWIKTELFDSRIKKKASWNSKCFYILSTDVPAFFKYQLPACWSEPAVFGPDSQVSALKRHSETCWAILQGFITGGKYPDWWGGGGGCSGAAHTNHTDSLCLYLQMPCADK